MYNRSSGTVFSAFPVMTICLAFCIFFVWGSSCIATATNNDSVNSSISTADILKKADEYRSPWPDFTMTATLTVKKEANEQQEVFRVFIKNHVKTLVSYIEPKRQRGNLLLMVDDNLWYYVNKTRRPVRITPLQRLSGGASYGDITKLDWSRDYSAALDGQAFIDVRGHLFDTWVLRLTAKTKSATYHTAELYIEKMTGYPRKAVVYLQSGKKMKTMYFTMFSFKAGKMMNTRIDFIDHLAGDRETVLLFGNVSVKKSPDSFFLNTSLPTLYSEVVF